MFSSFSSEYGLPVYFYVYAYLLLVICLVALLRKAAGSSVNQGPQLNFVQLSQNPASRWVLVCLFIAMAGILPSTFFFNKIWILSLLVVTRSWLFFSISSFLIFMARYTHQRALFALMHTVSAPSRLERCWGGSTALFASTQVFMLFYFFMGLFFFEDLYVMFLSART